MRALADLRMGHFPLFSPLSINRTHTQVHGNNGKLTYYVYCNNGYPISCNLLIDIHVWIRSSPNRKQPCYQQFCV